MNFSTVIPTLPDRDLVFDFFWKFSVFECALKKTGRLTADRSGNAKADWDNFGKEIVDTTELQLAAKQMIALAPKKQIVKDNANGKELAWKDHSKTPGETDTQFAMRLLRTVRNNLFHGGKYPDPYGPVGEIARDTNILQTALLFLEECYRADPKLMTQFDNSMTELEA